MASLPISAFILSYTILVVKSIFLKRTLTSKGGNAIIDMSQFLRGLKVFENVVMFEKHQKETAIH